MLKSSDVSTGYQSYFVISAEAASLCNKKLTKTGIGKYLKEMSNPIIICDCQAFQKYFICIHSLGLAVNFLFFGQIFIFSGTDFRFFGTYFRFFGTYFRFFRKYFRFSGEEKIIFWGIF